MSKWGFGIEKEFPILVGRYYKHELLETLQTGLYYYRLFFLSRESDNRLSQTLHKIKKYFIELIEKTRENINIDDFFYLNLENIYKFDDFQMININIIDAFESKYRFICPVSDFRFFYQQLFAFFTQYIPKLDSILGFYIRMLFFDHIRKEFVDYYTSGILYDGKGTGYILSKIDYIFDQVITNSPEVLYENKYKIEIKYYNGLEIRKYNVNNFYLEPDSGGFEVKTYKYRNTSIPDCVKELETNINNLKKHLYQNLFSLQDRKTNKYLHFETDYATMYLPQLEFDDIYHKYFIDLVPIYSGEMEFNITLPYNNSNKSLTNNIFKTRHIIFMKCLRLLSPLFLAVFTGVNYFSFGDNGTIPETSYRYRNLGYRLYTTLDIDNIYQLNDDDFYNHHNNNCIYEILSETNNPINRYESVQEFSVNRNETKYDPGKNKYFGFEWKVLDQYPNRYANNIGLFIILLAQWSINSKLDIDDTLNCKIHKQFLKEIIYQGWNTPLSEAYFTEICQKMELTELKYSTLNKEKLIKSCQLHKQLIGKKKIIVYLLVNKYTHLSYKQLNNLSSSSLYEILCKNFLKTKPTCYSFLQAIFQYLYHYFLQTPDIDNDIILSFFPNFLKGKYEKYCFIPNINLLNYNKMIKDYQRYRPQEFTNKLNMVVSDPNNEDYADLYYSGLK